ncbi:cyaA, partial [Symbiodinium pilosum]
EFIGDAILSVFGAPLRNPQHAEACVKATMKMLKSLDRINAWAKHRELPHIGIRCGVHTGEVLVGNMGFHSRIKYGTMGENASIPSKLEELNKTYSTTNLVSEDTWMNLPPDAFIMRPLDYIYLRSTDPEPSIVYNILAAADDKSTKADRLEKMARVYADGLANYRSQNFKKAGELFSKYIKSMKGKSGKEDAAAKLLLNRCKFYQENPPPRDWDGVWDQATEPS